jgi:trk system potassium uptake protein TrkA
MKIIVAGDGEVGFHLAKLLTDELHDITVVDPHSELLKMVESNTDLMTITGDSTSISILDRANVKRADLLISVLHDENVNLMTCIIGKKLGARKTIARINNTEFIDHGNEVLFNSLGIDHLVCPERLAAEEIVDLLDRSAATETFEFSKGKLLLFLIKLDEKALVIGKTLDQIASEFSYLDFRAVAMHKIFFKQRIVRVLFFYLLLIQKANFYYLSFHFIIYKGIIFFHSVSNYHLFNSTLLYL